MRIAAYQFAVSGNISENYKEIEKQYISQKLKMFGCLYFQNVH